MKWPCRCLKNFLDGVFKRKRAFLGLSLDEKI